MEFKEAFKEYFDKLDIYESILKELVSGEVENREQVSKIYMDIHSSLVSHLRNEGDALVKFLSKSDLEKYENKLKSRISFSLSFINEWLEGNESFYTILNRPDWVDQVVGRIVLIRILLKNHLMEFKKSDKNLEIPDDYFTKTICSANDVVVDANFLSKEIENSDLYRAQREEYGEEFARFYCMWYPIGIMNEEEEFYYYSHRIDEYASQIDFKRKEELLKGALLNEKYCFAKYSQTPAPFGVPNPNYDKKIQFLEASLEKLKFQKNYNNDLTIEKSITHPFISNEVYRIFEYLLRKAHKKDKVLYSYIYVFLKEKSIDSSLVESEYFKFIQGIDNRITDRKKQSNLSNHRRFDVLEKNYEDYLTSIGDNGVKMG